MNRIIIIGNGFDRALNIKSNYEHFIDWYLKKCLYDAQYAYIDRPSIKIERLDNHLRNYLWRQTDAIGGHGGWNDIVKVLKKNSDNGIKINDKYIVRIKKGIIKQAINDINVKGWADIERVYYEQLIAIFTNVHNNPPQSQIDSLDKLNDELREIKEQLQKYLTDEINEFKSKKKGMGIPSRKVAFTEFQEEDFIDQDWNNLDLEKNKNPEKVCILNFNYTNLFEGDTDKIEVINIHGELNNQISPIVFGYGDDYDENYSKIENLSEDRWLHGFKSFKYLKTNAYKRLLNFMSKNVYEVFVVGHSCGLSDKTLLKLIFEDEGCCHIKVFHSKELNNFDEIIYNISRVMEDKIKFRKRVGTKDEIAQVKLLLSLI